MGIFQSTPATDVPAFMLCDGHFEISGGDRQPQLAAWCGWIRFEGHGAYVIRKNEASSSEIHGQWSILDADTVRLTKTDASVANTLLVREGPSIDTLSIFLEEDTSSPQKSATFSFVPEEEGDGPMGHIK